MPDHFRRRIADTMRRRHDVVTVSRLSDSQLDDIGLTRHDDSRRVGRRRSIG